jgi:hypothetical protein
MNGDPTTPQENVGILQESIGIERKHICFVRRQPVCGLKVKRLFLWLTKRKFLSLSVMQSGDEIKILQALER